jgi:hypothetical protein
VHELVPVSLGDLQCLDEGGVETVEDRLLLRGGPAGTEVYVYEGHGGASLPHRGSAAAR